HYHALPKSTPYLGLFAPCLNFHIGPLIWPVPALFGLVRLHHRPEQFKHCMKLLRFLIGYSNLYRHIIALITSFCQPFAVIFTPFSLWPLCRRRLVLAHRSPAHKGYLLRINWITFSIRLAIAATFQTFRCLFT